MPSRRSEASQSPIIDAAFTLRPPVIFEAMTTFSRRERSWFSHEPMIRSVSPSTLNAAGFEGIGYCSAVSMRLTLENGPVHQFVAKSLICPAITRTPVPGFPTPSRDNNIATTQTLVVDTIDRSAYLFVGPLHPWATED